MNEVKEKIIVFIFVVYEYSLGDLGPNENCGMFSAINSRESGTS